MGHSKGESKRNPTIADLAELLQMGHHQSLFEHLWHLVRELGLRAESDVIDGWRSARVSSAGQNSSRTGLRRFDRYAAPEIFQSITSTPCAFRRSRWSFISLSRSGEWPCHSVTSPVTRSGSRER